MKNETPISERLERAILKLREESFSDEEISMSSLTFEIFEKENNIFNLKLDKSNLKFMGVPVVLNDAVDFNDFFIFSKQKTTHGGTRPGAGRPKSEIKRRDRSIRLSDEEFEKVKKFINEIRKR